jgi:recombination protein RecT
MDEQKTGAETHAVSTPNKRPATALDQFKVMVGGSEYQKQISNYFAGNKEASMKFMTGVVRSVQKLPKLLECDPESLLTAFMSAAELRLTPSGFGGEAYVLPYKGKAQFQIGYQGIITLLFRAGLESVRTAIIYKNDLFEYEEGLKPILRHKPVGFGEDKGAPIGVYAVAMLNGTPVFKVMSKEEVMKFKKFSQSAGSEYSPWNAENDPELHMWRKTAIKQLAKVLPKNEEVMQAIDKDNEESTIAARNNLLDAGGAAVGAANHKPETAPENGK